MEQNRKSSISAQSCYRKGELVLHSLIRAFYSLRYWPSQKGEGGRGSGQKTICLNYIKAIQLKYFVVKLL